MLCVANSVREYVGVARWLQYLSGGVPVQLSGEDVRTPSGLNPVNSEVDPYWGLTDGQQLSTTTYNYAPQRLVLSRTLTLTIDPATAYTYTLVVGTTPVEITTTAATGQADVPALLSAAWALSGLGLGANGITGGVTLTVIDESTFQLSAEAPFGGVPALDLGYGWTSGAVSLSAETYSIQVDVVRHTLIATYWGRARGRGVSKRVCQAVAQASGLVDAHDRLLRYTGQVAVVSALTELDGAALGDGSVLGQQDVSQVEITLDAIVVGVTLHETLAGVVLGLQMHGEAIGDVLSANVDTNDA